MDVSDGAWGNYLLHERGRTMAGHGVSASPENLSYNPWLGQENRPQRRVLSSVKGFAPHSFESDTTATATADKAASRNAEP